MLAGGSVYGLAAADGAWWPGWALGVEATAWAPDAAVPPSPVVPAAILFDLANGGDKSWGEVADRIVPWAGAAAASALENFALGTAGAGLWRDGRVAEAAVRDLPPLSPAMASSVGGARGGRTAGARWSRAGRADLLGGARS